MDLSVVIPTHNKQALLARTLEALGRQDPGPGVRWEVVVVDDGSTDGTGGRLEELARTFPVHLTVVTPPENVGRARARNLGARAARGRFLVFLDDDIMAPDGLLAAHLQLVRGRPDLGTIGFAVTDSDLIDAPHFHYLDTRGVARLPAGVAPARYFVTQNAGVPREAFLGIGGFDEEFSGYGFEDMELAFRLEDLAGLRFHALTRPVPVHIHHHSLEEYLAKKIECGGHTLPRLARLHPGRIGEMRLGAVLDAPGCEPGPGTRLLRALLDGPLPGWAERLVAGWPTRGNRRPVAFPLYCKVMGFVILGCFRKGFRETTSHDK
ncbi:glycosyltransferase [bacterium]|nr:glycosyltransferase [bacterium]